MPETMTRHEREDLQRLVRQREKVLKSAAKQRSAELLADFDNQLAAQYAFDDDAIWAAATKAAEAEAAKAKKIVEARCRELGIPKQFSPSLALHWRHRGYGSSVKERREELRRVAVSRIEAIEAAAIVQIAIQSVDAQTKLAVAGLTSEAAQAFVNGLPAIDTLMPALSFEEIAGPADPPVAEQLVSPNALRQRRYRDKQKALRGVTITPTDDAAEADGRDEPPDLKIVGS